MSDKDTRELARWVIENSGERRTKQHIRRLDSVADVQAWVSAWNESDADVWIAERLRERAREIRE